MSEEFTDRDLAGAVFNGVNLYRARFQNVNLAEAVIDNANLHNLNIVDANISGLTIFGLRIDELIAAEWDRRDPQRLQLRIADPTDPAQIRAAMSRLAQLRDELRERLHAADASTLVKRTAPDGWSALEHVRHLVFADALYLNHYIGGVTTPLPSLGLLSTHMEHQPELANVGTEPSDSLETVMAAWDAVLQQLDAMLAAITPEELARPAASGETVGAVYQGLALHGLSHLRAAAAALQAAIE